MSGIKAEIHGRGAGAIGPAERLLTIWPTLAEDVCTCEDERVLV
jgi:hypothetical protein